MSYYGAPPSMKRTVKICEKHDVKVRYCRKPISQIAKMMNICENKSLQIAISKFYALGNVICKIAQFNSRENLLP